MLRLDVPRREMPLDDPWAIPAGCTPAGLRLTTDGSPAPLRSEVTAFRDDQCLYVVFHNADDEVVATMLEHDAPLWEEDVVEVFLAPRSLQIYYEFEVNPLGTTFDAVVHSPDGKRETMRVDRSWECDGLWSAVRRRDVDGSLQIDTIIAIPFRSIGEEPPPEGAIWRVNFFRIDRGSRGDLFLAWSPTRKNPADFHVPAAFGELRFV